MKTILIVEDEKDIAEMLSVFLENEGYRTVTAGDGLEGLGLFARERADLVIWMFCCLSWTAFLFVKRSGKSQMCR